MVAVVLFHELVSTFLVKEPVPAVSVAVTLAAGRVRSRRAIQLAPRRTAVVLAADVATIFPAVWSTLAFAVMAMTDVLDSSMHYE